MCLELVPQVVYNMEKLKVYSLDKHVKNHVKNLTTRNKLLSGVFKAGSCERESHTTWVFPSYIVAPSKPMPDMPVAQAITSLELTVAFNKSDSTFGWNGFNRGLMLYYLSEGSNGPRLSNQRWSDGSWSPDRVKMRLMFRESMAILWSMDLHLLWALLWLRRDIKENLSQVSSSKNMKSIAFWKYANFQIATQILIIHNAHVKTSK